MKLVKLLVFILSTFALIESSSGEDVETGRVKPGILKTTVEIFAGTNSGTNEIIGTGFIVARRVITNEGTNTVKFLVTNKHMIGDWNLADGDIQRYYDFLDVQLYRTADKNGAYYSSTRIPITDKNGKLLPARVRVHPIPRVDVAIIALGMEFNETVDAALFDEDYLLPFSDILSNQTGLGDQVFALGYPSGITSKNNNFPLAKAGYISSLPGVAFTVTARWLRRDGVNEQIDFTGKILLIDGLITHGNSGGPVVIPTEVKTRRDPSSLLN